MIKAKITQLIKDVAEENQVFRFVYNKDRKFDVEKDWVYYSGPYRDNLVMFAALKSYFKWNDGDELLVSPELRNAPDMDVILALCNKYKIKLIMDNCDSLWSKWNHKFLTDYSVASSCSYYPAHHITTFAHGEVGSGAMRVLRGHARSGETQPRRACWKAQTFMGLVVCTSRLSIGAARSVAPAHRTSETHLSLFFSAHPLFTSPSLF